MKKKIIAFLCALVLCVELVPTAGAASDVIFIALNDNVFPLSADTMPFQSAGMIYVPYTTFDSRTATIDLGLYATYSERDRVVTVYNSESMLVFDLTTNSMFDYHTGANYNIPAITRNGVIFIPAYIICDMFGLEYSYYQTSYGALLRIKSTYWLSDAIFIDSASWTMSSYLKEYNQTLSTTTTTPTTAPTTTTEPEETTTRTTAYLSIQCTQETPVDDVLWSLETQHISALFLLTPDYIAQEGDEVRKILGSGHTIGIWAEGETAEETDALLMEGRANLAAAAYTTTALAQVPADQRDDLAEGWIFWEAEQDLSSGVEGDLYRYATALVRSLAQDNHGLTLTLTADQEMSDCLMDVLAQLDGRSFSMLAVTEFVV